jgi:hypothetical protein
VYPRKEGRRKEVKEGWTEEEEREERREGGNERRKEGRRERGKEGGRKEHLWCCRRTEKGKRAQFKVENCQKNYLVKA